MPTEVLSNGFVDAVDFPLYLLELGHHLAELLLIHSAFSFVVGGQIRPLLKSCKAAVVGQSFMLDRATTLLNLVSVDYYNI